MRLHKRKKITIVDFRGGRISLDNKTIEEIGRIMKGKKEHHFYCNNQHLIAIKE